MPKLAKNAYLYVGEEDKPAIVYDKYTAKLFEIPYSMGIAALEHNPRAIQLINEKIADEPTHTKFSTNTLSHLRMLVTNKCNLNCLYCYADAGSYRQETQCNMSLEAAKQSIDLFYAKYTHIKQISFFGGEPLMNLEAIEFVCEYVAKLHKNGLVETLPKYSMVTNATLLNEHAKEVIIKHGIGVVVSLDGDCEVHDTHRPYADGSGSFTDIDKIIRDYRKHAQFAIEATYTSFHERLGIGHADLEQYFKSNYDSPRINIVNVSVTDDSIEYLRPSDPEPMHVTIERFFEEEEEQFVFSETMIRMLGVFAVDGYIPSFCDAGLRQFSVFVDGGVYPCHFYCGDAGKLLGNVADGIDSSCVEAMFTTKAHAKCGECANKKFCQHCLDSIDKILESETSCQNFGKAVDAMVYNMLHLRSTDFARYKRIFSEIEGKRELVSPKKEVTQ